MGKETDLAQMFKALGEPTRLRIFEFLLECRDSVALEDEGQVHRMRGPTVGEVCCQVTGIEKATSGISFHLEKLRNAGLIRMRRQGKTMICSVLSEPLAEIASFLKLKEQEPNMNETKLTDRTDVRDYVRRKYGEAALRVMGEGASCGCSPQPEADGCCAGKADDPITSNLYSDLDASQIPETALLASLGCGNPTALAQLREGEVVLDLGSGGGIDVLLSARRVGPTGHAYGLDMTDEMLELAERNKAEAGAENVTFLKGTIEDVPLPDASVDVVISNCVINLSLDKDKVLREAFRVLRPGGRFAVSDVVVEGELPDEVRSNMELYVGCVSGALERNEYLDKLRKAGFEDAAIEPTRRYEFSQLEGAWAPKGVDALSNEEKARLDGKILGAFIRATKPAAT